MKEEGEVRGSARRVGTRDFYVDQTSPPTLANIHLQAGTVRRNRKDGKVTWTVFQLLQAGPRPGMTVKCVEVWSMIGVCESYRAASENSRSGPRRFLELQGRSLWGTRCAGRMLEESSCRIEIEIGGM